MVLFGSIFCGVASTVTMAGSPLLSVIWFPLRERTTATALAAGSASVGVGISFLTGLSDFFYFLSIKHSHIVGLA